MLRWIAVPICPECGEVMIPDEGDYVCSECDELIEGDEEEDFD